MSVIEKDRVGEYSISWLLTKEKRVLGPEKST